MRKTRSSAGNKDVYVLGAGGHARSVLNLLRLKGYRVRGFFDDTSRSSDETIAGIPVLGKIKDVPPRGALVLATGNNPLREGWLKEFGARVLKIDLVHPSAIIEQDVSRGGSNQVMANAYINSFAKVGSNNILNTRCVLEHEAVLGNSSHIAVGAVVCGRSVIGDRCLIGAGAVVIDRITVCNDVTIGAGAVVIDHIKSPGTYVGNPARKIK